MPKSGKDRRSARDQVRAPDQGGGLGSDEDYDWIRYLGEGRASSSSAVLPLVQPAARPVTQAAARPATLPARSRQDAAPVRERRPGRSAARTESAARANRSGLPPAGYAAEREPPSPADRAPLPRADRAPLPRADRVPLPPADRPSRPSRPPRPTAGPAVRLTAGRPVDLASGRETDLLFNPAADDYGQPLYPEPGSRPGRQQSGTGRSGTGRSGTGRSGTGRSGTGRTRAWTPRSTPGRCIRHRTRARPRRPGGAGQNPPTRWRTPMPGEASPAIDVRPAARAGRARPVRCPVGTGRRGPARSAGSTAWSGPTRRRTPAQDRTSPD